MVISKFDICWNYILLLLLVSWRIDLEHWGNTFNCSVNSSKELREQRHFTYCSFRWPSPGVVWVWRVKLGAGFQARRWHGIWAGHCYVTRKKTRLGEEIAFLLILYKEVLARAAQSATVLWNENREFKVFNLKREVKKQGFLYTDSLPLAL